MSVEKVKEYFASFGLEDRILEFPVSSATVELAAAALNCERGRIAKTLSFFIGEKVAVVVFAGDVKADNAKFKAYFGVKAKMLPPDAAEALLGHPVGGVCPFALNKGVEVFLDVSLKRFETIFPACGSANSAIELTPLELERYSNNRAWIDVGRQITEI
ncbi:MAG: YbaK/EbsC family protein [Christensenellales bacterium]